MMYEGEEVNTIDLLYEKPTTERNGVKVIIPVSWRDRWEFQTKIKEQLAYFESVYFDVENLSNDDVVIMRHDDFQWSSLYTDDKLHICLDNVYYPIDFAKLDISSPIRIPIALRFSLSDGLFPTPNRESLRYTRESKEVILKKLSKVADFFINKYNETVKDTDDIYAAMEYFRRNDRHLANFMNGKGNLNIQQLKQFSTIGFATPSVAGLHYETAEYYNRIRDYILGEYEFKAEISGGKFRQAGRYYHDILDTFQSNTVYEYSDRISGVKKDYLKSITARHDRVYIVKKTSSFKLKSKGGSYDNYTNILALHKYPKTSWRDRIKEFQHVQSLLVKKVLSLDNLVVPQEFIDARKKQSLKVVNGVAVPKDRRKKLEGEVTGKMAKELERTVYGQNCKFVPETIQMKTAHQLPYLMVYGGSSHSTQFDKMYSVFPKHSTRFMVFSERELTRLKEIELHNWIHIDKFMEGKHIVFKRAVTAYLIDQFIDSYRPAFTKINRVENISADIYQTMIKLQKYRNNYYFSGDSELYQAIAKVAEENNMYDGSIYSEFRNLESLFGKLPFINPIFSAASAYGSQNDGVTDAIRDLFKYYKQRIDWKHYNIKLNDEVVVTPVSEDSQIEELI